jgi:hypothetical protein
VRMNKADPSPSTERQRWARVSPGLAWKRPGLPTDWVPVLDRYRGASRRCRGTSGLDMPGKPRHVAARELVKQQAAVCEEIFHQLAHRAEE